MTSIAALLAFLVQSGICGEQKFTGPTGQALTVVVCPFMAPPSAANDDKPKVPA